MQNEASRQTKYNIGSQSTISFNNTTKQVHNIDSDGCGPLENWEKNFGPPQSEHRHKAFNTRKDHHHHRGGYTGQGRCHGKTKTNHCIACITKEIQTIGQEIVHSSKSAREKSAKSEVSL
jgi:hypothetical protein